MRKAARLRVGGGRRKVQVNSSSGVNGVTWDGGKRRWRVRVQVGGVRRHVGWYREKADAVEAYEGAVEGVMCNDG